MCYNQKGGDSVTIGERIKKSRLEQGLTQKQVADSCGMADSAIRKYESGKVTPKYEMLQRIAAALGVEWTELVPEEQQGQAVIDHFKGKLAGLETNIEPDDEETLKVLLPKVPELDPLTDEEVALKTLLNSLGYDIIKTRGKYFFNYEHGGSEISTDDLNELLNCAQNGLKVAAKTLELKLMHKVFTSISHTETAPQSPPSPQVSTDTTPAPEGAEGPQEGK